MPNSCSVCSSGASQGSACAQADPTCKANLGVSVKPNGDNCPKERDQQYRFLKIGNVQIAYREVGQGAPVLLVHGFGTSSYTWNYVVEMLPPNHRYIMLDLKGFGNSDKPLDHDYRISDQAAILKEVIQALRLRDVILVGHSYGGAVVLAYLISEGDNVGGYVRALILIDSLGYDQQLPPLINRLKVPVLSKLGLLLIPNKYAVRKTLKEVFFDGSKIPADLVDAYTRPLRSPGGRHAIHTTAKILAGKDGHELSKHIPSLSFPALIIWGEQDEILTSQRAYRFHADLPNSTLAQFIPNCGHAPQEECPVETATLMSDFLKRLLP